MMIPSISYDQYEILRWIRQLHMGGAQFELDPTFGKGNFYLPNDTPRFIGDLHPQSKKIEKMDSTNLVQFQDNQLSSIIFDPPFLSRTGAGSIIKDRFGEYPSMPELLQMYSYSLQEFTRVLIPGGILVFKCQNTVMGGKQWWSVDFVCRQARRNNFRKIDEFILLAKHRMERTGNYTQRHARKFHSYFLVFMNG